MVDLWTPPKRIIQASPSVPTRVCPHCRKPYHTPPRPRFSRDPRQVPTINMARGDMVMRGGKRVMRGGKRVVSNGQGDACCCGDGCYCSPHTAKHVLVTVAGSDTSFWPVPCFSWFTPGCNFYAGYGSGVGVPDIQSATVVSNDLPLDTFCVPYTGFFSRGTPRPPSCNYDLIFNARIDMASYDYPPSYPTVLCGTRYAGSYTKIEVHVSYTANNFGAGVVSDVWELTIFMTTPIDFDPALPLVSGQLLLFNSSGNGGLTWNSTFPPLVLVGCHPGTLSAMAATPFNWGATTNTPHIEDALITTVALTPGGCT